jgi:hypothetical protein
MVWCFVKVIIPQPIYVPFDAPLMADAKLPAPDAATVAGAGTSGG